MSPELARELQKLSDLKLVSSRSKAIQQTPIEVVNVGVTFRTDGNGKAHLEHDLVAIESLNKMTNKKGRPLFPFRVTPVALPKGAVGSATPLRIANWSDLDNIHLLYIPGGPTANDTQEGSSTDPALNLEERNFNRTEKPVKKPKENEKAFQQRMDKYLRVNGEHVSRAGYELRLLGIAKNRGIPILAVCAGSWRLLESYGGKVRTLEIVPRNKHKAPNPKDTWKIENAIRLVGAKMLIKLMVAKGYESSRLQSVNHVPAITLTNAEGLTSVLVKPRGVHGINSTHWAVASTVTTTPQVTLTTPEGQTQIVVERGQALAQGLGKPSDLLDISAIDPDTDTVEAFESLYGAPTMGIQWHPESYLPGMMGEHSGSVEAQVLSKALFELMGFAALTAKRRANLGVALDIERQAFDLLCDCARSVALRKMVGAGNAYGGACSLLSRSRWSGRMIAIEEAIDILGQYLVELDRSRPVAAGNLYRDAQLRLKEYGVTI